MSDYDYQYAENPFDTNKYYDSEHLSDDGYALPRASHRYNTWAPDTLRYTYALDGA